MVVNDLWFVLIISSTVVIPNIYMTKHLAISKIKHVQDLINVTGKVLAKTLLVTIISTIVFTLPILFFTNSDPGTAVAMVAVWLVELLAYVFCLFLTPIQLIIRKRR